MFLGFLRYINHPNSPFTLGYQKQSFFLFFLVIHKGKREFCSLNKTNLTGCNIIIEDSWLVREDTVLTDVYIKCYTNDCIFVQPGVAMKILQSTIEGHRNGRCSLHYGNGDLDLIDVHVFNCGGAVDAGGAVRVIGSSKTTIKSSIFINNEAIGSGGAVRVEQSSTLLVLNSEFSENKAGLGAAIYLISPGP